MTWTYSKKNQFWGLLGFRALFGYFGPKKRAKNKFWAKIKFKNFPNGTENPRKLE